MKVEIKKTKDLLSQNYEVIVDGERWARLDRINLAAYRVIAVRDNHIIRYGDNDAVPLGNPVTLPTQPVYERRWRDGNGPLLTFEQRATALIEQLITEGKLKPPSG